MKTEHMGLRIPSLQLNRAERIMPRLREHPAFYAKEPNLHATLLLALSLGLSALSAVTTPLSAA